MKYFGGILLLLYTAMTALGYDRIRSDERGKVGVHGAGIRSWHDGFMGGK